MKLTGRDVPSDNLRDTWRSPSDILSILMIIGGDIVLKALAQISGRSFSPVAFSFGWVAYAFSTLMTIYGEGRLMPRPDYDMKVINAQTAYQRDNKSWVIARLLRDFEYPLDDRIGLCVTVLEADDQGSCAGVPSIDWCWLSGLVVTTMQLGIAAIPLGISGDWSIIMIAGSGAALAFLTGTLPQWRHEKWACRRNSKKVISLTAGNGSRHVMVIIGRGVGLDLEDLAASEAPKMRRGITISRVTGLPTTLAHTQLACFVLTALWIVFLVTVSSLKQNSWYTFAIGSIGMIQNVIVAGVKRGIGTSGIHLEEIETFRQEKVMDALMDVDEAYPKVGRSLLSEFFPGELRSEERSWWDPNGSKLEYLKLRESKRPGSIRKPEKLQLRVAEARNDYTKLL